MKFEKGQKIRMKSGCGDVPKGSILTVQLDDDGLFVRDPVSDDYCACQERWQLIDPPKINYLTLLKKR